MDRRTFSLGCAACCVASGPINAQSNASRLPPFCSIDPGFDLDRIRRYATSGDSRLDHALIVELRKLLEVFPTNPGFQFFDDTDAPNALAWPRTLVSGTQGTIFFGRTLIQDELLNEFGGAAVAGIAAHEMSHIYQYFSSFSDRLVSIDGTARRMELHADFMAGYYFSQTGRSERSLVSFGESLFSKGDFNFNQPDHHGTPEERVAAMEAGYAASQDGAGLEEATQRGIDHVS